MMTSLQLRLHLLDIANAFLQGNKLQRPRGRLFVEIPAGGLPGVEEGSVIELISPVYGLNDAPMCWDKTVCGFLKEQGWVPCECDPCLMVLRSVDGKSIDGILMIHVDDVAFGGQSPHFWSKIKELKSRFEFGLWLALRYRLDEQMFA